jgi:hypothetical protein
MAGVCWACLKRSNVPTGRYILHGTVPVEEPDLLTWAQWFESAKRHVADTWVTPTVRVSTVFLGLDHQWGDGPPLLWETMIFHEGDSQETWRYATYHAAEQGHERAIAWARTALPHLETS